MFANNNSNDISDLEMLFNNLQLDEGYEFFEDDFHDPNSDHFIPDIVEPLIYEMADFIELAAEENFPQPLFRIFNQTPLERLWEKLSEEMHNDEVKFTVSSVILNMVNLIELTGVDDSAHTEPQNQQTVSDINGAPQQQQNKMQKRHRYRSNQKHKGSNKKHEGSNKKHKGSNKKHKRPT